MKLLDQGFLSRVRAAQPSSTAGTRYYKETEAADDATIKAYGARILFILENPAALAAGERNELDPPALLLSVGARAVWIAFHDHVESQLGRSGDLATISGFAARLNTRPELPGS